MVKNIILLKVMSANFIWGVKFPSFIQNLCTYSLLIVLFGCSNENPEKPIDQNLIVEQKTIVELKEPKKLPTKHEIEIKERINEEEIIIKISYELDTVRLNYTQLLRIQPKNIQIQLLPKKLFTINLEKDLENLIKINQIYSADYIQNEKPFNKMDLIIKKEDLNFDGKEDFYFVNEYGIAQNIGYEVYLFNKKENRYKKSSELSKQSWSKIEIDEDRKTIILYNHVSSTEGFKHEYEIKSSGKMNLVSKEILMKINRDKGDNKVYKITGRYIEERWTEDTILIN